MSEKLKNVIIAGSTGMTGKSILERCLKSSKVNLCTSIVRKKTGIEHPKLKEIVHDDFKDFSKIENHFKDQDIAYYTIGVYTGSVPEDKFKEIIVDYTNAFAKELKKNSLKIKFCFLSGDGADPTLKSSNLLTELKFDQLYIFRPGYIYPVEKRQEPNTFYKVMRAIYPWVNPLYPPLSIKSTELSDAMFEIGLNGGTKTMT